MELRDLLIGDIVMYNGKAVIIDSIDNIYDTVSFLDREAEGFLDIRYTKIQPVVLTPGILDQLDGFEKENVWNGIDEYRYIVQRKDDIEYHGLKFSTNVKLTVSVNTNSGEIRFIELYAFTKKGIVETKRVKSDEPYYLHELQHLLLEAEYDGEIDLSKLQLDKKTDYSNE